MNSTATGIASSTPARIMPSAIVRWTYPATSALLFLLMLMGFQQFYRHGRNTFGQEILRSSRWSSSTACS